MVKTLIDLQIIQCSTQVGKYFVLPVCHNLSLCECGKLKFLILMIFDVTETRLERIVLWVHLKTVMVEMQS